MTVLYAAGTWGTIANVCFLLSAVFSDLLILRFFLCAGFAFLLISGALGLPDIPDWTPTGLIAAGIIAWSAALLLLHFWSFIQLLWDERRIHFKSDDEEQLYRFFFRRCGMGRLEFKALLEHGKWKRYKAGDPIYSSKYDEYGIYLIVEGVAGFKSLSRDGEYTTFLSGEWWDFAVGNIFGIYVGIGFEGTELDISAETDVLLMFWSLEGIDVMATKCAPAVSSYWRLFLLSTVGSIFARRVIRRQDALRHSRASGGPESQSWLQGARSLDFVEPLRDDEVEKWGVREFFHFLISNFHPTMPPGVRHTALPRTGQLARSRELIMARDLNAVRRLSLKGALGVGTSPTQTGRTKDSGTDVESRAPLSGGGATVTPMTTTTLKLEVQGNAPGVVVNSRRTYYTNGTM